MIHNFIITKPLQKITFLSKKDGSKKDGLYNGYCHHDHDQIIDIPYDKKTMNTYMTFINNMINKYRNPVTSQDDKLYSYFSQDKCECYYCKNCNSNNVDAIDFGKDKILIINNEIEFIGNECNMNIFTLDFYITLFFIKKFNIISYIEINETKYPNVMKKFQSYIQENISYHPNIHWSKCEYNNEKDNMIISEKSINKRLKYVCMFNKEIKKNLVLLILVDPHHTIDVETWTNSMEIFRTYESITDIRSIFSYIKKINEKNNHVMYKIVWKDALKQLSFFPFLFETIEENPYYYKNRIVNVMDKKYVRDVINISMMFYFEKEFPVSIRDCHFENKIKKLLFTNSNYYVELIKSLDYFCYDEKMIFVLKDFLFHCFIYRDIKYKLSFSIDESLTNDILDYDKILFLKCMKIKQNSIFILDDHYIILNNMKNILFDPSLPLNTPVFFTKKNNQEITSFDDYECHPCHINDYTLLSDYPHCLSSIHPEDHDHVMFYKYKCDFIFANILLIHYKNILYVIRESKGNIQISKYTSNYMDIPYKKFYIYIYNLTQLTSMIHFLNPFIKHKKNIFSCGCEIKNHVSITKNTDILNTDNILDEYHESKSYVNHFGICSNTSNIVYLYLFNEKNEMIKEIILTKPNHDCYMNDDMILLSF